MFSEQKMIEQISWSEFQKSGFLWWVNRILHTFGLVICLVENDGKIVDAYPARTKFRGFNKDDENEGYKNVADFIKKNHERITDE